MTIRRKRTEPKAEQPGSTGEQSSTGEAAAPAAAAPVKDKNDARIARLEKKVEALHTLLHDHGIRHKAVEPATTE